jgi:hypothetical protein
MATIPARTASGRRCQTAASTANSVVIGLATISPPKGSERLGDHQRGCLALPGWCVSRRGKIQIPNPEKNQEPIVDSGSTPLGALRGWATPTAAPCHWLEHRLHKPGVARDRISHSRGFRASGGPTANWQLRSRHAGPTWSLAPQDLHERKARAGSAAPGEEPLLALARGPATSPVSFLGYGGESPAESP